MKTIYRELTEQQRRQFLNRFRIGERLSFGFGFLILFFILLMFMLSLLELPPYQPLKLNYANASLPPSAEHWLGTDGIGRDTLSLLMVGTQAYFLPGLIAIAISLGLGASLGALAGFYGGWIKTVMNYISDTIGSFPRLILILMTVAILEINIYYIMIMVGLLNAPKVANLVENKFRTFANTGFIEADQALGFSNFKIIFDHILWRNCLSVLIVQATYGLADVILIETTLSYLGIGVPPDTPSWGNMVASGRGVFLGGNFWPASVPAVTIMLSVLGLHQAGDTLNRLLDV